MEKDCSYTLFTDASFNATTSFSTYSIVVMKDCVTEKIISKKSRIKMNTSTECEIFAIYQAINLILSNYIDKSKIQKFRINTDCIAARSFYLEKEAPQKAFFNYSQLYVSMKTVYKTICSKLAKTSSSFKIKWIPRESNIIAHSHSYSAFKRLRAIHEKNDLLVIDQKTFFEVLMKFDRKHLNMLMFLYNASNNQKIINMTQTQMSYLMQCSIPAINKHIKELEKLNIIHKIKNGKYSILI